MWLFQAERGREREERGEGEEGEAQVSITFYGEEEEL